MLPKFSAFFQKRAWTLLAAAQQLSERKGQLVCSLQHRWSCSNRRLMVMQIKKVIFFDNRLWAMTTAQKYSISIYQQISANISLCNFGCHCYWILTIEAQKRWKQLVNIPAVFYPVLAPLISPGLAPTPTLPSHCFISFHCTLSTYRSSETLIRNRIEQF